METEKMESYFLQAFWDLPSVDEKQRCGAASNLVQIPAVLKVGSKENEYTIKRLVRGLGSSRAAARQGFALALTELFRKVPELDVAQVLESIESQTVVTGSIRGQQERDLYFGRLFGYMAIVRSERISEISVIRKIVLGSLKLAEKKSWLCELCYEILSDLVEVTPSKVIIEVVLPCVFDQWKISHPNLSSGELSPAQLSLILTFQENVSDDAIEKNAGAYPILKQLSLPSSLSDKKSVQKWKDMEEALKLSCASYPRLHSVWIRIITIICKPGTSFEGKLVAFWKTIVDGVLVPSTHERRSTAILLLLHVAKVLIDQEKPEMVATLLSRPLLTCIVNNAASEDRYLHQVSKSALEKLVALLKAEEDDAATQRARVTVVCALVSSGHRQFDKRTKTDTVKSLLSNLKPGVMKSYISFLQAEFLSEARVIDSEEEEQKEDKTSVTARRTWAADSLYAITKSPSDFEQRIALSLNAAKFLMQHAYFSDKGGVALRKKERDYCAMRLACIVNDMASAENAAFVTSIKKQQKGAKLDDDWWNVTPFATMLTEEWFKLEKQKKSLSLLNALSDVEKLTLDKTKKYLKTLQRWLKKPDVAQVAKGLQFLLSHITLNMLCKQNNEDVAIDAVELVDDLVTCADQLCDPEAEAQEDEEEMVVLVDLMLALLSQPSTLFRTVVRHSFGRIGSKLTPKALDTLLEALVTKNALERNENEENEDEKEEEEEEEEVEMEVDNTGGDEESDAGKSKTKKEGNQDDEEESDEEDEESDALEAGNVDAQKIANMLIDGVPSDSDDDDDVQNEEFSKYDSALANYFKLKMNSQQLKGKALAAQAEKQNLHFKHRVLDLVETFCITYPESELIALLPCALLEAAVNCFKSNGLFDSGKRGAEARSLFEHIRNLQNKIYKAKLLPVVNTILVPENGIICSSLNLKGKEENQESDSEKEEEEEEENSIEFEAATQIEKIFSRIVLAAIKSPASDLVALCRNAMNFLIRLSKNSEYGITKDEFAKICDGALKDWICGRRSKITSNFFSGIIETNPDYGWALVEPICKLSMTGAKSSFQRCEALRVVGVSLRRIPSKDTLRKQSVVIWDAINDAFEQGATKKEETILKTPRLRTLIQLCNDLVRTLRKNDLPLKCNQESLFKHIRAVMEDTQSGALKTSANQFFKTQDQEPIETRSSSMSGDKVKTNGETGKKGQKRKSPKTEPAKEAGKSVAKKSKKKKQKKK